MPKFLVTVSTTVWEERLVPVEASDKEAAEHDAIERICDPDQEPIPIHDRDVAEHDITEVEEINEQEFEEWLGQKG